MLSQSLSNFSKDGFFTGTGGGGGFLCPRLVVDARFATESNTIRPRSGLPSLSCSGFMGVGGRDLFRGRGAASGFILSR